jgi:hypothetical protein
MGRAATFALRSGGQSGDKSAKRCFAGLALGTFVRLLGHARPFLPWDTADHIATNISELLGQVVLAIPVGLVVGFAFKHSLFRRFGGPITNVDQNAQ